MCCQNSVKMRTFRKIVDLLPEFVIMPLLLMLWATGDTVVLVNPSICAYVRAWHMQSGLPPFLVFSFL